MAIFPPYPKKGDTIGIVCPAGYMPYEKAETCIHVLKTWGYQIKVGKTLGSQLNYFSATDGERLEDLQQMLDDDAVQAILCGRGGYGTGRIIDNINFKKFCRRPKWIIGYSDITILHSHIYRRYNIASIHSPMAAAFNDEEYKNKYVQSLRKVLAGKKLNYTCEAHAYNKKGEAQGELVGGNLSLVAHLIGTPSDVTTNGKILFLEDIGEYIYTIDRMMHQLMRNGKFNKLAGLVIGGFSEMKDTTIPYGKQVYDIFHELLEKYNFPICYNFPVSHERENYALKIGAQYYLKVSVKKVELKEL